VKLSERLPLAGLLLMAIAAPGMAQDDLAGDWVGIWTRDGDTLAVEIAFERDSAGWRGAFDSERLRVVGIPFNEVTYDAPRVEFHIVGDATTLLFQGELRNDSLSGTFREDSSEGAFLLVRRASARPELREEEVAFESDGARLAGSLILPAGTGPHPAVVILHGSGAEGRWASRYLAVRLARAGHAALIFDKRGVGESTGDWRTAGLEELAGDARAAVRLLAGRPEIDASRIGIHGHSQGGTLSPLVAAGDSLVAFVVASAAAGLPTDVVEIFSVMNTIEDTGIAPEDTVLARQYVHELVAVAYHGHARARLDSLVATARGKPWFFEPPPPESSYWTFSRRFAEYDPIAHWRRVEVPVLLLFGENDRRVPSVASIKAIVHALLEDGVGNVTARVFAGAGHTFRIAGAVWPRTVPGYPDALLDWLASTIGGTGDAVGEAGAP
jgi:dienelactone hydrolase